MPSRMSFLRLRSLAAKSAPQQCRVIGTRGMSSSNLNRPSPPPLPRELQREFEELQRSAQMPLSSPTLSHAETEAQMSLHPDARKPLTPEFDGDVNPRTGEQGGPKREPVRKWSDDGGDWSFKGRVSDF
ncbi:uncharacterized protein F5147DRAFT_687003 [Suillus discolor]|uniref:Succinate dehydrogenase assembly factor 4, mitochondrial n=1 Tax=Suillus discolor TaxID=1912936 RepID=A0A9P7JVV1_9AGAM|nr:uncharacterized protein F5147DRAFT_687003 [Suillus discolor]KAG2111268.1 hypothetical protein F5147DRAFT_687003 [Suillus discolor]